MGWEGAEGGGEKRGIKGRGGKGKGKGREWEREGIGDGSGREKGGKVEGLGEEEREGR